ncbi:MAG: 50S ribosomal protein L23, partial [Spirochaetes bacterium]|nr:50S ribosomal protein L23 [Spirochaetota bacterium]
MNANDIIIRPVITEKATEMAKQNKYIFRVHKKANKDM